MRIVLSIFIMFFLSTTWLSAKDKLVVGMELAYPPFEMTDKQGNPEGLSVDLAKAFGEYLGREVEIQNIAWDGLIPALKTGKVDVVISSMTITEEREKTVDFSKPYSKSYLTLLISNESDVKNIDDINKKGKVLAVKKGSTGHMYAIDNLPNAKLLVLDKESSAVLEVVQGRADGFIYDQLTVFRNHNKHKNKTRANLEPFQDDYEYWGMAFKEGSPLVEKSNDFIEKFREDGGFEKLSQKYLKEIKKSLEEQGIPFFL